MVVEICKRCQSRYSRDRFNTTYIHECVSEFGEALRDEDILVTGDWEDYTGSATEQLQSNKLRGNATKLFGTRPWIEDPTKARLPDFTVRGKNRNIYRTRQHLAYNDLKRSSK